MKPPCLRALQPWTGKSLKTTTERHYTNRTRTDVNHPVPLPHTAQPRSPIEKHDSGVRAAASWSSHVFILTVTLSSLLSSHHRENPTNTLPKADHHPCQDLYTTTISTFPHLDGIPSTIILIREHRRLYNVNPSHLSKPLPSTSLQHVIPFKVTLTTINSIALGLSQTATHNVGQTNGRSAAQN